MIIKYPVSEEQRREQATGAETAAAFEEVRDLITAEKTARTKETAALQADFSSFKNQTNSNIEGLIDCDTALAQALTAEVQNRQEADATLRRDYESAIAGERTARQREIEETQAALLAAMGNDKALEAIENEKLRQQIESAASSQSVAINTLTNNLNAESQSRAAEDVKLQGAIAEEVQSRKNADAALKTELNSNINKAVASLDSDIALLNASLDTESKTRSSEDVKLQGAIAEEVQNRKNADAALKTELNSNINKAVASLDSDVALLNASLDTESKTRSSEDVKLQGAIADEVQNRKTADSSLKTELNDNISKAVAALDSDIALLNASLDTESKTRSSEDVKLQGAIADEVQNRKTADASLKTELNGNINKAAAKLDSDVALLSSNLDSESKTRSSEDVKLQSSIATEIKDRKNADSSLKSELTATFTTNLNNATAQSKSYVDSQLAGIESTLNDFTVPTATKNGTRGLVPAPPKGTDLLFLTSAGWRSLDDSSITISTLPSQKGSLTYNGSAQSPEWLNFDNSKLKIEGNTSGTNAATYTVTFTPLDLYIWSDSLNQEGREQSWQIGALKLSKPTASVTAFDNDGKTKTLSVSNYNSTYMNRSGTYSASATGNYTVTYSLKNKTNTTWADGSTANVVINWSISQRALTAAQSSGFEQVGTLTYTGNSQSVSIKNYDANYHTLGSDTTATNAGTYEATISPKSGSTWSDGTTTAKKVSWKINPKSLTKPTASTTSFDYDGASKTLSVTGYDTSTMTRSGTVSESKVGSYSVTYALKDKSNYTWADASTTDVVINWAIGYRALTAAQSSGFEQVGTLTYTGNSQSVSIKNYDADYHSLGSTTSATNAGTYEATISPKSGSTWSDGTTTAKKVSWKINPKALTKPTASTTSFDYDGASKTLSVTGYDTSTMTRSGTVSESKVGSYSVTYSLKDKTNYTWSGGSTEDIVINWSIGYRALTAAQSSGFEQVGTLTYTGNSQSVSIKNYDADYHSLGSTTSATNAGTYEATISPKSGSTWSDGTTTAKKVSWKINPKSLTKPTASTTSFDYDGASKTLSVTGYDTSTMTRSGTVSESKVGSYSVTYSLKDKSNYTWADASTTDVVINWAIGYRALTAAQSSGFEQVGTLTYTGNSQSVSIKNYDADYHSLGSTTSATNAGTYEATISPKSGSTWSDGTTTAKKVSWKIRPLALVKPIATPSSFEYDGTQKTLRVTGDISLATRSGTISEYKVGSYSVTYSLKDKTNYTWSGGSTEDIVINWSIVYRALTAAQSSGFEQVGTLTYTGDSQTVTIKNYDTKYHILGGDTSGTDAGTYEATVTPKSGYTWADGTSTPATVSWKINPILIPKPTLAVTTYEYTGKDVALEIVNYDKTQIKAATAPCINVGSYDKRFDLINKPNYAWEDGTTGKVRLAFEIVKKTLTKPTLSATQITSLGINESHSVTVSGFDSATMTQSGTTSTDTGTPATYTVTFALKDANNYCWTGGSSDDLELTWSVVAKTLSAAESTFTQDIELYFDQKDHSATEATTSIKSNYVSKYYTLTDDTNRFGDKDTIIKLTAAAKWSDGTTANKVFTWTIGKGIWDTSGFPDSYEFSDHYKEVRLTQYHTEGDPYFNFADPTVAYTEKSGNHYIKAKCNGTTTLTMGQAESTHWQAWEKTIQINVSRTFNNFTWTEIAEAVKDGWIKRIAQVGDEKLLTIVGTFPTIGVGSTSDYVVGVGKTLTLKAVVIGINHNPVYEGTKNIHFALMKSDSKNVALGHSNCFYANYHADLYAPDFPEGTHYGNSTLRTQVNSLLDKFPAALQEVISPTKKRYVKSVGTGSFPLEDKIWLLCPNEVLGEKTMGGLNALYAQYEYFKNGNSISCCGTNTNNKVTHWTRVLIPGELYAFDPDGDVWVTDKADGAKAFVPCFEIRSD